MDRRTFVTLPLSGSASILRSASVGRQTATGINPYTGPWDVPQTTHLLKRTLFGARKADVEYFKSLGLSGAVNELLNNPVPVPAPPVNNYNVNGYVDPTGVPLGQTWVNAPYGDGTVDSKRVASFKAWWIGRMLNQSRSLLEKMVLFWHDHFATETTTMADARFAYQHNVMLRRYALTNFRELVKQVTLDPGMLIYLNGYLNRKQAPDENYGRELQELFTVGKGPNSRYTESDVQQAARVLTGHTVQGYRGTQVPGSIFDPTRHDANNKSFSFFYGNTVITGKSGAAGATELDDLLNMIFATEECALFICRKLYRWFVYYDIDQTVEDNVIAPLAGIFRKNNYDIKPVLAALFQSEHFFDPLNRGCVIKSPIDFTVGLCREFGVRFPDAATQFMEAYGLWDTVRSWAASMQQNIGDPPDVSGWKAYYQAPQFHEIWINSDTLPKRNQFSDAMIGNGYTRNGATLQIDPLSFAASLPNPEDPNKLISDSLNVLYMIDLSPATRDYLKTNVLLSGQNNDYYWTNAWNDYKANPTDATRKSIVLTRLKNLYKYIMELSEFQLS